MRRARVLAAVVLAAGVVAACSGSDGPTSVIAPTSAPASPTSGVASSGNPPGDSSASTAAPPQDADVTIMVDPARPLGEISPLIRGLSSASPAYISAVGATLNSWGGNPSTRYNYELGHAWNHGRDYEYRNTNYGQGGDVAETFLTDSESAGAAVRLAVPTLGWVAKNDDGNVCSFPSDGGCGVADGADCSNEGVVADPETANVRSTPEKVQAWVQRLVNEGHAIDFIAMDNEPELWGINHYDVHPECPTYEEVLDRYLTYATAIRQVAPDARLLGPVACCWYDYWRIAPGPAEGEYADYLSWFLEQVRKHDEREGGRSLDVLDVHYYPLNGVYDEVRDGEKPAPDAETAALRLRSTRSLWDPSYLDESWISEYIAFIPRMRETIERFYPGTELFISEWNFGADHSMNGALAIADVLGVYGREGVDMASYWRFPEEGSPGYFAFKMHGNYDGGGSSFTGTVVPADSDDVDRVATYAALDPGTRQLKLLLINKQPDADLAVHVDLGGYAAAPTALMYRYSEAEPNAIVPSETPVAGTGLDLVLPRYSITLLDLSPAEA